MVKYEKTSDPNIIKEIKTVESEIHLNILQRQINEAQAQIDAIPEPKNKPDTETLEEWNMLYANPEEKQELINSKNEKQMLKDLLEAL